MADDDFIADISLPEALVKKYLKGLRGKIGIQKGQKRLDDALEAGEITPQQYDALLRRLDEMEEKVYDTAAKQRKAVQGRAAEYADVAGYLDPLVKASDYSWNPWTLQKIAAHMNEIKKYHPEFDASILPWSEWGQLSNDHYSVTKGEKEDARGDFIIEMLDSMFPKRPEQYTEKEVEEQAEEYQEQFYDYVESDVKSFIIRATHEEIAQDSRLEAIVVEALANEALVNELRAEGYGEAIDGLLTFLGRDVEKAKEADKEAAENLREFSLKANIRREEDATIRKMSGDMDEQMRRQAEYTASATKTAMRELLGNMADRFEKIEKGQMDLAKAIADMKEKGVSRGLQAELSSIKDELQSIVEQQKGTAAIRNFVAAEHEFWKDYQLRMERAGQGTCASCGQPFQAWSEEVQNGFGRFPEFYDGHVYDNYWATCDDCHRLGWQVWVGRWRYGEHAWAYDDESRDSRAVWKDLGVMAAHYPSQGWSSTGEAIPTDERKGEAVEHAKMLQEEGEHKVTVVGPFVASWNQTHQIWPTLAHYVYDMVAPPKRTYPALMNNLPHQWLISAIQQVHHERKGVWPLEFEVELLLKGGGGFDTSTQF